MGKYILATVLTFIGVWAYEFLLHGVLLADIYHATADVWRNPQQMQELFPFMFAFQLAFAATFVKLFAWRAGAAITVSDGVQFGIHIGVVLGVLQAAAYPYLPIPLTLAAIWALGMMLECIVLGTICGAVYRTRA